jgi:carbon storage regulator CsrA
MLVLSRKLQQQIKIGDQISVTILRVKGNTVRLGIQAPRDVRVVRGELPKTGETTDVQQIEGEATVIATGDENEDLDESTGKSVVECSEKQKPVPAAAHLPLLRIKNRHGSAPLKQVIASCAALAK